MQFEKDAVQEENFEFYRRDRDRIVQAGLKLYTCSKIYSNPPRFRIRTYSITNGNAGGTWKDLEKFESLTAMKNRVKELEREPDVIFDGRI